MKRSSSYKPQYSYGNGNMLEEKNEDQSMFFSQKEKQSDGHKPFFQTKLTVGEPGDTYEKEADAVADKVVNNQQAGSTIQQKEISGIQRLATPAEDEKLGTNEERMKKDKLIQHKPEIQCMCASCTQEQEETAVQKKEAEKDKEEEPVQAKASGTTGNTASPAIGNKINASAGKGSKLPAQTLVEMSNAFGYDFSQVNIHTGSEAVNMNKALSAQAFTHGSDIYFNSGKFDPESASGKHLLAHELTHVIQQGNGIYQKLQRQCTAPADCTRIAGSAARFNQEEEAREAPQRDRRGRMTPRRAMQNAHAGRALQLEIFANREDPTLLTHARGIFIDQDMSPNTGALTTDCADWTADSLPPGATLPSTRPATSCIFVHGNLNQQALEYNTTRNPTIGGVPREIWRLRTLQTIAHESQHITYDAAVHRRPGGVSTANCTFANIQSELTELNAILAEFPRVFRATPRPGLTQGMINRELNSWFRIVASNPSEGIRGIMAAIGCKCECSEVNHWIEDTFNFVAGSWTPAERTFFNTRLRALIPTWPL